MTHSFVGFRRYLDQFYQLTDSEFEQFTPDFFLKNIQAKQKLVQEGDIEDNIYFIAKGILRKYFHRGKEQIVTGFYKENDICLSVISYFSLKPSTITIETIEPTICVGIKKSDLEKLMNQLPLAEKIFRGILSSLYVKKDAEQINNLRYSKKERFLLLCEKQPDLLQSVPQKQLASYLEITPETFCRMKRFRYDQAKEARQTAIAYSK